MRLSIQYAEPERNNSPLMHQAHTASGDMSKQPAHIDQATWLSFGLQAQVNSKKTACDTNVSSLMGVSAPAAELTARVSVTVGWGRLRAAVERLFLLSLVTWGGQDQGLRHRCSRLDALPFQCND